MSRDGCGDAFEAVASLGDKCGLWSLHLYTSERDLGQSLDCIAKTVAARVSRLNCSSISSVCRAPGRQPSPYGVDLNVSEAASTCVRRCMAKRFEVHYKVNDEGRCVLILAFLHGSRDVVPIVIRGTMPRGGTEEHESSGALLVAEWCQSEAPARCRARASGWSRVSQTPTLSSYMCRRPPGTNDWGP